MEAAETIVRSARDEISDELTLVHTLDIHTIEDICHFLETGIISPTGLPPLKFR